METVGITEDSCEFSGVKSENIPSIWPHVAPLIERALAVGGELYTVGDIFNSLMFHKMQLWIVVNEGKDLQGCVVTEFSIFPQALVCRVLLVAGDRLSEWIGFLTDIEEWAMEQGATRMQSYGRLGWEPFVKRMGYTSLARLYEKELRIDKSLLQ